MLSGVRSLLKSSTLLFGLCFLLAGQNRDLRIEPIDAAARRSFEKQVKVALVVGISVYPQGSGLSSLKYAARDADVLGAALKSQGYLVRKLVDSDATRAVIRRTLRELSDVVSPDEGTFLFFFGGHGYTYKGTNYLATFGSTAADLDGEGLAVADVETLLRASKAKRKLLFVDACRSAPEQGARASGQRTFDKLQASEGIRVLFSTKEGRVSFEDDALRQGVFTYFLVKGLEGEAAGTDGLVTFRDLADYLTDRMRAYTVERGQVQIPFEAGESSGDFLLSVGKGTPPSVAPTVPALRAGATKVNPKDGLTYVWIPPGTFQMGCSPGDHECNDDEKPPHQVTISSGFWMGQTEVTQEAYERVVGTNPSHFNVNGAKLPVETVDWINARDYCQAADMRLPTEAEWEYAARAGSKGSRYGDLDRIAWYGANSRVKTHEVGQKEPNAWSLYDMLGNLWEWVADWYAAQYSAGSTTDPRGSSSGTARVMRGGTWFGDTQHYRASIRSRARASLRQNDIGFRCAGNVESLEKVASLSTEKKEIAPVTGAPKALLPGARKVNPKDGLTYVWIPPGTFQMGCSPADSECAEDEKPRHQVTISNGFWMGQTEATQEAYERLLGTNPSRFKGAKLPVENIGWYDARGYCQAAGMRLPTEAEWEYAARAGSNGSRYGDLNVIAWHSGNSGKQTHEVGQKQPNSWGLYDMLGNVWEWVAGWYTAYTPGNATDPQGSTGGKVRSTLRGGGWHVYPRFARASVRTSSDLPGHDGSFGVRCAGN